MIHCLIVPVAIVLVPALTIWFTLPEAVHLWAFLFAVPTSVLALASGYRGHRRCRPTAIAVLGLVLLGMGVLPLLGGRFETSFSVAGALLLAIAHILNWRAVRSARS